MLPWFNLFNTLLTILFKYLSNNLRAKYSIRYIIYLTRILHLHLHLTDILDLTDPYSGCLLKPFGVQFRSSHST
jgi:hypothetical protein